MPGGALTLRFTFDGHFGPLEAKRATDQLEGAAQGAAVHLDFTRCEQIDAGSVARLVQAVTSGGGVPRFLGLSRHDLRVLHYLIGAPGEIPGQHLEDDN
jgi:hypothetical protein